MKGPCPVGVTDDETAVGRCPCHARATISATGLGRTHIDIDGKAWNEFGLAVGDRVMVETRAGDIASAEVTDHRIVTVALSLGDVGDRVRVRRPQGASHKLHRTEHNSPHNNAGTTGQGAAAK